MSPALTVKKQMENLREAITYRKQLYQGTLLPEIDDAQLVLLVDQLKTLEMQYPEFAKREVPPLERFVHFTGASGMNIRGLGPKLIERLMKVGKLTAFSDIYRLTQESLKEEVPKQSATRAKQIWIAIQESRFTSLQRLLMAFNIRGLGPSHARPLAFRFQHDLLRILDTTDPEEFKEIAKISLGRAKHLIAAFQLHKDEFRALLDLGISWNVATPLQGKP